MQKPAPRKAAARKRGTTATEVGKAKRSKDTVSRTARGTFQFSVAETIVRFVEAFGPKLSEDQHVACLALLTLVIAAAQNLLENAGYIPRLLKPKV